MLFRSRSYTFNKVQLRRGAEELQAAIGTVWRLPLIPQKTESVWWELWTTSINRMVNYR